LKEGLAREDAKKKGFTQRRRDAEALNVWPRPCLNRCSDCAFGAKRQKTYSFFAAARPIP